MSKIFPDDFATDTNLTGSEPMIVGNQKATLAAVRQFALKADTLIESSSATLLSTARRIAIAADTCDITLPNIADCANVIFEFSRITNQTGLIGLLRSAADVTGNVEINGSNGNHFVAGAGVVTGAYCTFYVRATSAGWIVDESALIALEKIGADDGSTVGSLRADVNALEASVGAAVSTVIWRPTEPSPSGNVYADITALFAAIATKRGSVTIVCDHSLSSTFTVTAAAYPLLCAEIRFVGHKNSPATVAIADGVTFTGGTIRSLVIDSVRLEWRGTGSPLIPAVTTTLHIDLYRGGILGADNGNTAVMFEIDEFAIVRLHDPMCQVEASNYEIFRVADSTSIQVYLAGFLCTVSGDFARSSGSGPDDGGVQLFYVSTQGPTYPAAQTNLGGTYSKTDGVPFSLPIITLQADVATLISNGSAYSAGIGALETTYAPASRRDETTNAYTWFLGAAIKLVRILENTAKTVVTLDSSAWLAGNKGFIQVDNNGGFGVEIVLATGTDTVNGQAAGVGYSVLPGSTQIGSTTRLPAAYEVAYLGGGVWTIRALLDLNARLTTAEGTIATNTSDLSALTTRVTTLESPTSVDTTADLSPGYTWTTAKRVHATDNTRSEGCNVLLDSASVTTGQWPVGESREFAKYNTSIYGLGILVGTSDTLNGGATGVGSGIIGGSTAVPTHNISRPIVTIRRDTTTGWSWF